MAEIANKKPDKITILQESVAKKKVSDKMMKDAFVALTVSIFNEFSMGSDRKFLIFNQMINHLAKMDYSQEELDAFVDAFNSAQKRFDKNNDFMG